MEVTRLRRVDIHVDTTDRIWRLSNKSSMTDVNRKPHTTDGKKSQHYTISANRIQYTTSGQYINIPINVPKL